MKLRSLAVSVALTLAPVALASMDARADAPAAPAAAKVTANGIADRIQAFYDKTQTFQADFVQRYVIKAYGRTKDSRGKVTFEKPGKMSWRYTTNGNRVVADGKLLKVYEEENKQLYEQPIEQSQYPAALSFLTGGGNLKQSFTLEMLDAEKAGFSGGYVIAGEPKDPTPAYQKLILYVDGKTSQVRRVMLIDAQGNRNRFDFQNPVVNKKPLPDEFRFVPPKGTKTIRP